MSTNVGSIDIRAILDSDEFQQGLKQLQRDGDNASISLSRIGKTMGKAIAAAGVAVKAAGIAAINVGGQFERSMLQIKASTGMTAYDVDSLGIAIRDMALQGNFSARQIADALSNVAIKGMDAAEATRLMEYSMTLALATGNELGKATEFLSLALMKAGTDTRDAERYINAFTQTTALSGMALGSLEKAIITLAPTMNMTGASIEEVSGALAVLYRGGIAGVAAGRGLEQIVNSLISPTDAAAGAMKELGINIFDANGAMRPLNDVLLETMDALDDVATEQERFNLQNQLFSTVYARGVFNELQTNRAAWQENIGIMYEATGAIDGTGIAFQNAEINSSGFLAQLRVFPAIGSEMLKILFDIINAPLGRALNTMADAARDLLERMREGGDLHPHVQRLGDAVSGLITAVGNMITAVMPLVIRWLPTLANILVAVLNTAVRLAPVLIAVYAAFKLWKIAGTIIGLMDKLHAANLKFMTVNAKTKITLHGKKVALGFLGKAIAAYNAKLTLGAITVAKYAMATKKATVGFGFFTKALAAVKIAFAKLAAVMLANPIGLLIGGVGLLTAGIVALTNRTRTQTEEERRLRKETERVTAARDALNDAMDASARSHEDRLNNIEIEAATSRNLLAQLKDLKAAEDDSAEGRARMQIIVNRLNDSISGLNLVIDEETGLLNKTAEAIYNVISARQEQARQTVIQERMLEVTREQMAAEREMKALRENATKLFGEHADAILAHIAAYGTGSDAIKGLMALMNELGIVGVDLSMDLLKQAGAYYDLGNAVERAKQTFGDYIDTLVELETRQEDVTEATKEKTAVIERAARKSEAHKRSIERQTSSYHELVDVLGDVGRAFQGHYNTATAALRGVGASADTSVADVRRAMQESIKDMQRQREAMQRLNGHVPNQ